MTYASDNAHCQDPKMTDLIAVQKIAGWEHGSPGEAGPGRLLEPSQEFVERHVVLSASSWIYPRSCATSSRA
jgi:hypothetical protein